ncbi:hypothetical protein LTR08_006848 [Meristemomyces frigidus]|nr:hypothetical protein LTR08_006848 [Meristemomyces frigidus]
MVCYETVQSSNSLIPSTLPPHLVAVFVGATSDIGEYTLKAFAKHTKQPRVYFIGRSQESADRITKECLALNPEGEFIFIKSDISLIKNVDVVCQEIKARENVIDLLVLSQGTLSPNGITSENLRTAIALTHYSRTRFTLNVLPLLRRSAALRRVLTIFAGGKEGHPDTTDWPLWKMRKPFAVRGHVASMVTLSLEHLATEAPEVSFLHSFPGPVRSGIARSNDVISVFFRVLFGIIGTLVYMPDEECGERHLLMATSARFAAGHAAGVDVAAYVPLGEGLEVAEGTDGEKGSGVYIPDAQNESAGPTVVALLEWMKEEGLGAELWEHTEGEFMRICGSKVAV